MDYGERTALMGFETQEEAERFVEAADAYRDMLREMDPKERAWLRVVRLPAFKELPELHSLIRQVFDYAWEESK